MGTIYNPKGISPFIGNSLNLMCEEENAEEVFLKLYFDLFFVDYKLQ